MYKPIESNLRRPGVGLQQQQEKETGMTALLNIIYREYCRARLAEMRQPALLLLPTFAPFDNALPR